MKANIFLITALCLVLSACSVADFENIQDESQAKSESVEEESAFDIPEINYQTDSPKYVSEITEEELADLKKHYEISVDTFEKWAERNNLEEGRFGFVILKRYKLVLKLIEEHERVYINNTELP